MIKVTLVKSVSNEVQSVKATVEALGLRKIGCSKVFKETPALLGQLKKVGYLLKTEKVGE